MLELRIRNQKPDAYCSENAGKLPTSEDYSALLTGPTRVLMPDGRPLCVYLPKAVPTELTEALYPTLHSLKPLTTGNRGYAGGTPLVTKEGSKRARAKEVSSAIIGAFDKGAGSADQKYCRLTAWTGRNLPAFQELFPLFQVVAENFKEHVPERYAAQMAAVAKTHPDWVIPNSPFTTVTVNNTYSTGIHKDKGDLEEGFSSIVCVRRGNYKGSVLCFPQFGVGADLQDGDLILMDAHQWHANTPLEPLSDDAERISVVSYFRTKITECGSEADELAKAQEIHDPLAV